MYPGSSGSAAWKAWRGGTSQRPRLELDTPMPCVTRARSRAQDRTAVWWAIGLIFVTGLIIRLVGFDQSLWLDEFATLWTIEGTLTDTWRRAIEFQGQTPLYYVISWVFLQVAGESEATLRLPSLVFVAATVPVLVLAGHWIGNARAGVMAAGLFWVCGPAVRESANARPYGLVLLATALAVAGFVRATTRGDRVGRALWISGAILLFA